MAKGGEVMYVVMTDECRCRYCGRRAWRGRLAEYVEHVLSKCKMAEKLRPVTITLNPELAVEDILAYLERRAQR